MGVSRQCKYVFPALEQPEQFIAVLYVTVIVQRKDIGIDGNVH